MKYALLIISLLVIHCTDPNLDEMGCYKEHLGLTTQAEVDEFNKHKYDCVSNGMSITGDNLVSVELPYLGEVLGGQLIIENTSNLTSVHFPQLDSASLSIKRNEMLESFRGFETLNYVGELFIVDNPALKSLDGLNNLDYCRGWLSIGMNPLLDSLAGLSKLENAQTVLIFDNNSLETLSGLSEMRSVGGELEISGNRLLPNCEICTFLSQLTTLPTESRITINGNMEDECGSEEGTTLSDLNCN